MQNATAAAMRIPELRKVLKRPHYPLEVMLVCARWYAAYPLSFRHLEELMQERENPKDTDVRGYRCIMGVWAERSTQEFTQTQFF